MRQPMRSTCLQALRGRDVAAMVSTLDDIKRLTLASELVQAGLRLSIIVALTGLTVVPLRRLWREMHGKSPPNGKLPESVLSFITTQSSAGSISAFVALHQKSHRSLQHIDPAALLSSWKTYNKLCSPPLDINAAYYVVRDVRSGFVSFPRCTSCGAHFIYDTASTLTNRCPFCGDAPAE